MNFKSIKVGDSVFIPTTLNYNSVSRSFILQERIYDITDKDFILIDGSKWSLKTGKRRGKKQVARLSGICQRRQYESFSLHIATCRRIDKFMSVMRAATFYAPYLEDEVYDVENALECCLLDLLQPMMEYNELLPSSIPIDISYYRIDFPEKKNDKWRIVGTRKNILKKLQLFLEENGAFVDKNGVSYSLGNIATYKGQTASFPDSQGLLLSWKEFNLFDLYKIS